MSGQKEQLISIDAKLTALAGACIVKADQIEDNPVQSAAYIGKASGLVLAAKIIGADVSALGEITKILEGVAHV
jgi:hypothetical protein